MQRWADFGGQFPEQDAPSAAQPVSPPVSHETGEGTRGLSEQVICTKLCLLLKKPLNPQGQCPDFTSNRQTTNTRAERKDWLPCPLGPIPKSWRSCCLREPWEVGEGHPGPEEEEGGRAHLWGFSRARQRVCSRGCRCWVLGAKRTRVVSGDGRGCLRES